MRFLLIILGAFAAVVCIEKPAEAQNGPWCIYKPGDESPQCRYATLEQCLADRLGKGENLFTQSVPALAGNTDYAPEPPSLVTTTVCAKAPAASLHWPQSAAPPPW